MSVRRLAAEAIQPPSFAFTPDNQAWARMVIARYPEGRQASAVIPLLWRAQEQHDYWLPKAAIELVAQMLSMPTIRVLEVATFYTMFNLEPVGRFFVQLCGTTPCRLRGAEDIVKVCESRIGPQRHVSADGNFSWLEVECLGSCCNAPMVQINNDYYEDLTPESFNRLLDDLAAGRPVKKGPQSARHASEPEGAVKTLQDPSLYDGSVVGAWRKRFAEEEAKARDASAKAAAEKAAADKAVAAEAAQSPKPGKPSDNTAGVKAADTPAARVADGKAPTAPAVAAAAADASKSESAAQPASKLARSAREDRPSSYVAAPGKGATEPAGPPVSDEHKPTLLSAPEAGKADDLELIWGVGPKLGQMLNGMGIYHFSQIAAWNEMNLRWVDQNLGAFRGRAVRDKWIEQAAKLATGWRPDNKIGDKPTAKD
ncbi:MAG: NADH-quinone oxidoreductase subunit NuoE [Burkholderiales bacterium]|nr:NADH-quinone oxidoreductase subunit NuoE [Burkholderiales bacterium]